MRAREERVLQHAARRRIDDHRDAIDRRRGGCASRSSSASVRSVRTSRIGDGSCNCGKVSADARVMTVTSPSTTCSTAAPRSRRSRRVESGSRRRVRTKDNGSSPSIGQSSSSDDSNRSSGRVGTIGRMSSPRATACQTSAECPRRAARSAAGSAASSPSVFRPHRFNALTAYVDRLLPGEICARSSRSSGRCERFSRIPIGSGASASASPPGSTIVNPGRASARTSAAVRVRASATWTPTPRAAAPSQLLADGARRTEQSVEAADVDRYEIVAMSFVSRRELRGEGDERTRLTSPRALRSPGGYRDPRQGLRAQG